MCPADRSSLAQRKFELKKKGIAMRNVRLLMKYGLIFHVKAVWRVKWQFLLLLAAMAAVLAVAAGRPPKLFSITYYNADGTYASKMAIDNFTEVLKGLAEMEEVQNLPAHPAGDVFIYFPKDFADRWQYFESLPVEVYILTQQPLYQALLRETFQAYEEIMLGSEAVISVYNQELADLRLTGEQAIAENIKISLDFLSLAFQRQRLYSQKPISALPGALTRNYYFFSLTLFFGLLLGIYWNGMAIEKRQRYRRLFLSQISKADYLFSEFGLTAAVCLGYSTLSWLLGKYILQLMPAGRYFGGFVLLLLAVYWLLGLAGYAFHNLGSYYAAALTLFFFSALFGGAFLPLSFFPTKWLLLTEWSPFYHGFLFLLRLAAAEVPAAAGGVFLVVIGLTTGGHFICVRRAHHD